MSETIQIIDLLFRGPSGWLVLAAWGALSSVTAYFTARHRFRNVRETTHALVGGDGKFKAQGEGDIDDMFRNFERQERRLQELRYEVATRSGEARAKVAEQMMSVANQMRDECGQMFEMNIAFRTNAGHGEFHDRVNERYRRAKDAYDFAANAKRSLGRVARAT